MRENDCKGVGCLHISGEDYSSPAEHEFRVIPKSILSPQNSLVTGLITIIIICWNYPHIDFVIVDFLVIPVILATLKFWYDDPIWYDIIIPFLYDVFKRKILFFYREKRKIYVFSEYASSVVSVYWSQ